MIIDEVYKRKENSEKFWLHEKICISSFATRYTQDDYKMIIVANTFTDESMFFSSPSFCIWFENEEEILKDYELFMTQEEYQKYLRENWK
jgi:hypothetical protein